jgi:hypothetical protein
MKPHLSSMLLLGLLAAAPLAQAQFYIREQNGTLTTDLPAVTIVANPLTPAGEGWDILISGAAGGYKSLSYPPYLAEPTGELGVVNKLTDSFLGGPGGGTLILHWESDLPAPPGSFIFPTELTTDWNYQGSIFWVTFEDRGDAPVSNVPDGGASAALLCLGMAGCVGLKKKLK